MDNLNYQILGSDDFNDALKRTLVLYRFQTPLTVLAWLSITSQNYAISSMTAIMIILSMWAAMTIFQYTEVRDERKFGMIPCAVFFILCLSFTSFWSLLMVGCSNDKRFSMAPFVFSTVQLFATCIWCKCYCSIASHVEQYLKIHGRGGYGDDDFQRAN